MRGLPCNPPILLRKHNGVNAQMAPIMQNVDSAANRSRSVMTDPAKLYAQAEAAFNTKQWQLALEASTKLLSQVPDHAHTHYFAGQAALELRQMPQALRHLQRACQLFPRRADYVTPFAKALSLVNLSSDALAVAERALTLTPLDAHALDTLGVVFTRANAHERATALYRRAVTMAPQQPSFRYNLAKSLVFLGHMEQAEGELERCLQMAPHHWAVHLTLSQLRRQTVSSNHLERLHALLPHAADLPAAQLNLHMSLAKEYEDLADYPRAFKHMVAGKAAGRLVQAPPPQSDQALFDAIVQASPKPCASPVGLATREPIFIVGMPRSGTTLVERIISSHPDVHAAGELANFPLALKRLSGSTTPHMLDIDTIRRSQSLDWQKLGNDYLLSTRPDTGHKPRFIDKLPHNFLHLGAIANALPEAKIICLRRDPVDTCLSNFRQLFSSASPYHNYSFDLLDTGRYFILFDRLMAHWKREFPGRILEVDYETIVETQEASSRQLIDFCGLPWNDACLQFETNQAPATTASAVQVREPMYRSALKRWKHYEAELTDLRQLLADAGMAA